MVVTASCSGHLSCTHGGMIQALIPITAAQNLPARMQSISQVLPLGHAMRTYSALSWSLGNSCVVKNVKDILAWMQLSS